MDPEEPRVSVKVPPAWWRTTCDEVEPDLSGNEPCDCRRTRRPAFAGLRHAQPRRFVKLDALARLRRDQLSVRGALRRPTRHGSSAERWSLAPAAQVHPTRASRPVVSE